VLAQRPWRYYSGTFWDLPQVPIHPRIDYIYHTSRFWVVDARVLQQKISDHYPILAILAPTTALSASPASSNSSQRELSSTKGQALALPVFGSSAPLEPVPCGIDQSD
jgi:hypothetical protein